MQKKAQVLMISLWILVILTILAVSIAHRVSLALRLSRYQKDRTRAIYLAKAGINLAIREIENDNNGYDSLNDGWANNETRFGHIAFSENKNEYACVSYTVKKDEEEETIFGALDEESKININSASWELLVALLKECQIDSVTAEKFASDILAYRGAGELPEEIRRDYDDNLGYACKRGKFTNIEELRLVRGSGGIAEKLERLKTLITVYGDGKININTASREALKALTLAAVSELLKDGLSIGADDASGLTEKILDFRKSNGYFTPVDINTAGIKSALGVTDDNGSKIVDKLVTLAAITAVSSNFKIEAQGHIGSLSRTVTAVVKRLVPAEIIYWHEN